uniref:Uncharacterized protein n=1 Tax=Arundo donax TaxID=35708 RepID=A0A0A9EYS4_ARUDO
MPYMVHRAYSLFIIWSPLVVSCRGVNKFGVLNVQRQLQLHFRIIFHWAFVFSRYLLDAKVNI